MIVIGITGGIGMGKSTVAEYLVRRGECVIDTDVLARELVQPGQPALSEIKAAFGTGVIKEGGHLNRSALAEIVFRSDEQRRVLEGILHPKIRDAWKEWVVSKAGEGMGRAVVVIPLLFETGAEKEFDTTVCVASSFRTQRERLRERRWTEVEMDRRIHSQMPIREKMGKASRVVWNESSLHVCELQVARIFDSL